MSFKAFIVDSTMRRTELDVVHASEYDAIDAENAALRKDAERYRWLKKNATDVKFQGRHVVRLTIHCLDAAIDAAMEASYE